MSEFTINVEDNGNKDFETVRSLIEDIEHWKKWAIENNRLDEFLDLKINLLLQDINGVSIYGDTCLNVGWAGERFVMVGNVQSVVE